MLKRMINLIVSNNLDVVVKGHSGKLIEVPALNEVYNVAGTTIIFSVDMISCIFVASVIDISLK